MADFLLEALLWMKMEILVALIVVNFSKKRVNRIKNDGDGLIKS